MPFLVTVHQNLDFQIPMFASGPSLDRKSNVFLTRRLDGNRVGDFECVEEFEPDDSDFVLSFIERKRHKKQPRNEDEFER